MPVKHCSYGTCKSDSRHKHKDHMKGVFFVRFPQPYPTNNTSSQNKDNSRTDLEKCKRWIYACGRRNFGIENINKYKYICSRHFVGGMGPSAEHPDPIPLIQNVVFEYDSSISSRQFTELPTEPISNTTGCLDRRKRLLLDGKSDKPTVWVIQSDEIKRCTSEKVNLKSSKTEFERRYCLRLCKSLFKCYKNQHFCDTNICTSDGELKAHRVVLSSTSSYFRSIFSNENFDMHSGMYLVNMTEFDSDLLDIGLCYMYTGELNLCADWLEANRIRKQGLLFELFITLGLSTDKLSSAGLKPNSESMSSSTVELTCFDDTLLNIQTKFNDRLSASQTQNVVPFQQSLSSSNLQYFPEKSDAAAFTSFPETNVHLNSSLLFPQSENSSSVETVEKSHHHMPQSSLQNMLLVPAASSRPQTNLIVDHNQRNGNYLLLLPIDSNTNAVPTQYKMQPVASSTVDNIKFQMNNIQNSSTCSSDVAISKACNVLFSICNTTTISPSNDKKCNVEMNVINPELNEIIEALQTLENGSKSFITVPDSSSNVYCNTSSSNNFVHCGTSDSVEHCLEGEKKINNSLIETMPEFSKNSLVTSKVHQIMETYRPIKVKEQPCRPVQTTMIPHSSANVENLVLVPINPQSINLLTSKKNHGSSTVMKLQQVEDKMCLNSPQLPAENNFQDEANEVELGRKGLVPASGDLLLTRSTAVANLDHFALSSAHDVNMISTSNSISPVTSSYMTLNTVIPKTGPASKSITSGPLQFSASTDPIASCMENMNPDVSLTAMDIDLDQVLQMDSEILCPPFPSMGSDPVFSITHDINDAHCRKTEVHPTDFRTIWHTIRERQKRKRSLSLVNGNKRFSQNATSKILCSVCGIECYRHNLERHLKRWHEAKADLNLHSCTVCSRTFTSAVRLDHHLNCVHEIQTVSRQRPPTDSAKKKLCDLCGKLFDKNSQLGTHERSAHSDVKPFQCSMCDKSFKFLHSISMHLNKHTNSKPYACKVCSKSFAYYNTLKTHELIHVVRKQYACRLCEREFAVKCNFKAHIQRHHSADATLIETKPSN